MFNGPIILTNKADNGKIAFEASRLQMALFLKKSDAIA